MPFRIVPLFIVIVSFGCMCAEEPKPAAKSDASLDQKKDWLEAIERLRVMPLPGEFKNIGLSAELGDVFEISESSKGEIKKVQAAYGAEILKRAAKWAEEQKALRAEYEAKILESLPEARRESAKKALETSHAAWHSPLERDNQFKRDYENRVAELQENRAKLSVDELNEAREKMHGWVREQRDKVARNDEQTIVKLKELLAADEAERLQKLVRLRTPEPEAPPTAPAVDTKEPKKEKKKK